MKIGVIASRNRVAGVRVNPTTSRIRRGFSLALGRRRRKSTAVAPAPESVAVGRGAEDRMASNGVTVEEEGVETMETEMSPEANGELLALAAYVSAQVLIRQSQDRCLAMNLWCALIREPSRRFMSMDLAELSDMEMVYEEFLLNRYRHLYLGMYARGCNTLQIYIHAKNVFQILGSPPVITVLL